MVCSSAGLVARGVAAAGVAATGVALTWAISSSVRGSTVQSGLPGHRRRLGDDATQGNQAERECHDHQQCPGEHGVLLLQVRLTRTTRRDPIPASPYPDPASPATRAGGSAFR